MHNSIRYFNFYGLKFSSFNINQLKEDLLNTIASNSKKVYFGYSLGTLPYFKKYPEIASICNEFDVMVADGRGMYLLLRLFKKPIYSDISIPNLTQLALEIANENKYSVMIVGSTPENNYNAVIKTRKKYKNAIIYDGYDGGDFSYEAQMVTVEKINKYAPDILFIGVSSPKKEKFVGNWKDMLKVKVIIPFGGAIDILSGKSKPIPKLIKKLCLGGFYRFIQEPRRLFRDSIIYVFNVMFIFFPVFFFNVVVKRNKEFCIPGFYNRKYKCENF